MCWEGAAWKLGVPLLAIVEHGVLRPLEPSRREGLAETLGCSNEGSKSYVSSSSGGSAFPSLVHGHTLGVLESAEVHLLDVTGAGASEGPFKVEELGDATREERAEEAGGTG